MFLLGWLLTIAKLYAFTVATTLVLLTVVGKFKFRHVLPAALGLYILRPGKFAAFYREISREMRVAELDEHDLALIEANKEVSLLLGEGK